MSSTKKTPEHCDRVCSSPEEAAAVEAAAVEAAAVEAAAASGGAPASEAASGLGAVLAASDAQAAAEVAVCRGEVATTARPDHFPIASKAAAPAIFSHVVTSSPSSKSSAGLLLPQAVKMVPGGQRWKDPNTHDDWSPRASNQIVRQLSRAKLAIRVVKKNRAAEPALPLCLRSIIRFKDENSGAGSPRIPCV
jgi:hypothetical protein